MDLDIVASLVHLFGENGMTHSKFQRLSLLAFSGLLLGSITGSAQTPGRTFVGNTSVLPPGWSGSSTCLADCVFNDTPLESEFMSGPAFTDPINLTIESCVAFCNAQGSRLAGLKGTECRCANIYNPSSCFESDGNECEEFNPIFEGCPGNNIESCGVADNAPPLFNIFTNQASQFSCSDPIWPGGAALTAVGSWRFSYFYNDSVSARALPHNAVNLHIPLPRGNLTTEACVTACGNANFTIAGVEFADECYCGNAIQNGARPITNCAILATNPNFEGNSGTMMRCKGNTEEFCGGPNLISIYTLPGTGLIPILPFDPAFNNFCSGFDCPGHT